jgi:predicted DNA-binding ArsR family transcriptional regulator
LTPRKRKLYRIIRRKESALCKLRKKFRSRKLKDLCEVGSDPLLQEISKSLNADFVRLFAAIVRNSRHNVEGKRWNFQEKFWLRSTEA